jgi:hypothetical protein
MKETERLNASSQAVACATTLAPYEHHELAVKWGYGVLNVGSPLAYVDVSLLLPFLPACLPACLSACLPTCLPACLPACLPCCCFYLISAVRRCLHAVLLSYGLDVVMEMQGKLREVERPKL